MRAQVGKWQTKDAAVCGLVKRTAGLQGNSLVRTVQGSGTLAWCCALAWLRHILACMAACLLGKSVTCWHRDKSRQLGAVCVG